MLTLWGAREKFCDGLSRRNFLKIGALGAGALGVNLSLAEILRLRAQAGTASTTRNKAAILIYLPGGPSHMDMYDLKPEAPKEFRGEFKPIATNVPGVQICEHFPMQAKMWDKLACIRSIVSVDEHTDTLVMTGYPIDVNRTANHPSFGAVVSKMRSNLTVDVPPFVSLRGMSRGSEPGYLGIAHRPFSAGGPGLQDLKMASGVDQARLEGRKGLLNTFDDVRREIDGSGTMAGIDSYTSKAIDMVVSGAVRTALDLNKEDPKVRERYKGVETFLTARRLVEAGVGCVTLSIGGWDTHGQNFKSLAKQLPLVDRGVANLIQDLHDRGLAQDVVDRDVGRVRPDSQDQHERRSRSLVTCHGCHDRRRRTQDGPGGRRQHGPRRTAQGSALHRASGAQHHVPGHRHRPGHDLHQRLWPADAHPR